MCDYTNAYITQNLTAQFYYRFAVWQERIDADASAFSSAYSVNEVSVNKFFVSKVQKITSQLWKYMLTYFSIIRQQTTYTDDNKVLIGFVAR